MTPRKYNLNNSSTLSRAFITLLLFIISLTRPINNLSQTGSRLELLHSDVSKGMILGDRKLRILEGNVHARQDRLELFCDRATYDERDKIFTLKGNVHLYRSQDTLLAKEVRYFEQTKIALAEGNVKVYRPGQEMYSDFLEYHYDTDKVRATGNLYMHDRKNLVYITGKNGEYIPELKYSFVKEKAHFWRVDSSTTDTLHIYSKKLEYLFGDSRRALAKDSVKIIQKNLHATCDSAIYFLDDDIINLEVKPSAVQENSKIYGKRMQMFLENQELKLIRVSEEARAISIIDTALRKENRLEGQEIVMYISNRELTQLQAISNARSYYHLKEGEENRGINAASADTITAFFLKNEIDSIAVIGGAQGTYYPQDYKGPIVED